MKRIFIFLLAAGFFTLGNGCGVPESDYKQLESELAAVKEELSRSQGELNSLGKELLDLQKKNQALKEQAKKDSLEIKRLETIARAKSALQERQPQAKKPRIYTVKPGDTLWQISRKAGVSVEALMKINNIQGTDIKVGQELLLP